MFIIKFGIFVEMQTFFISREKKTFNWISLDIVMVHLTNNPKIFYICKQICMHKKVHVRYAWHS